MKTYGGVDILIHIFLTSALVGGKWSASHPGCFTPGKEPPDTHCVGGWVDPKAGLENMEKCKFLTVPGLELRPFSCPAYSQSLYHLCYPRSIMYRYNCKFSNDNSTTFLVLYSCRVIDYIIKINVLCSIIIESTYIYIWQLMLCHQWLIFNLFSFSWSSFHVIQR
jgi:hypothetical protein